MGFGEQNQLKFGVQSKNGGKTVKKYFRFFVIFLAFSCLTLHIASAQVVNIPDPNLAEALRERLGLAPNAPITRQDMQRLEGFTAIDIQIRNLTGLEHATQLQVLHLNGNQIRDLNPLTGLTQLLVLSLSDNNQISNISPLAGLTQLFGLGLSGNQINDISPLARLTQLEQLYISGNQISDISPLTQLTQLEQLHINRNQISDISPLTQLTQLTELAIRENQIRDVSPLTRLTRLKALGLEGNQISDIRPLSELTQLEVLSLSHNQIRDVSPLARLTQLKQLYLHWNDIRDVSPLAKLVNLEILRLAENPIADTSPLTSLTKLVDVDIEITASVVEDINADGVINIQDLVLVASNFGETGESAADVNADGIVDIRDLVLVASAFGTAPAAPSLDPQALKMFTAVDVENWLIQAQHLNLPGTTSQKGIRFLEQFLASLIPKEMALLPNYPNPFNPETWIPYQLAKPADVQIAIYDVRGMIVRRLALGHQSAEVYHNQSRAAYWDGRNAFGEAVANGVYFYTLTAGDFTATRKMLIRK